MGGTGGELSGLMLPGDARSGADQLRAAQVDLRATELQGLLARAAGVDAEVAKVEPELSEGLGALAGPDRAATLDLPLLARQLRLPEADAAALSAKARGAILLLMGGPPFAAILERPQDILPVLGRGPHYLPNPHVVATLMPEGRRVERRGRSVGFLDLLNGVAQIHTRDPSEPWPCLEASHRLGAGLDLLAAVWPAAAESMGRWYRNALLLHDPGGGRYLSFTSQDLPGAYIATASSPAQVCDSMVHEASHARLAVVRAFDPLILDDGAEIHPSPWRPDPRPLMGLVAGAHAFINVHAFYARLHALHLDPQLTELAERKLADHRAKLLTVWPHVLEHVRATPRGASFLAEMDAYLRSL